jgi:hypothetical protein
MPLLITTGRAALSQRVSLLPTYILRSLCAMCAPGCPSQNAKNKWNTIHGQANGPTSIKHKNNKKALLFDHTVFQNPQSYKQSGAQQRHHHHRIRSTFLLLLHNGLVSRVVCTKPWRRSSHSPSGSRCRPTATPLLGPLAMSRRS